MLSLLSNFNGQTQESNPYKMQPRKLVQDTSTNEDEPFDPMKVSATDPLVDSGFITGTCTTESDLGMMSASNVDLEASNISHKMSTLDSGYDVTSENQSGAIQHSCSSSVYTDSGTSCCIPDDVISTLFTQDVEGDTHAHVAAEIGDFDAILLVTKYAPHETVLDIQNIDGQTALHKAVIHGHWQIAELLVTEGARVDIADLRGELPLHYACRFGDLRSVYTLTRLNRETFKRSAIYDQSVMSIEKSLNQTNYSGECPIHLAALKGHHDIIKALSQVNADVNVKDLKGGRTPLHYAVGNNHGRAVRTLAEDCKCELDIENYAGYTAYQVASEFNSSLAAELCRYGATACPVIDSESDSDYDLEE